MRIAMVSAHFELPVDSIPIGGVQRHIARVSAALRERGHEVMWTYPGITAIPNTTSVIDARSAVEWCDALVMHDFCSWMDTQGKPNLVVFHGWEGQCPPDAGIMRRRQEIAAAAGATIAVGAFIPKWYGHQVDEVIWGAVDPPGKEESTVAERDLAVWIGRLDPDTSCLDAIRWAVEQGYRVEVYGDGDLRVPLEQMRDSIPGACVLLYGWAPDAAKQFSRAAVALPSGLLTLLEAESRGKPCYATWANPLKQDYWMLHPYPPAAISPLAFPAFEGLSPKWQTARHWAGKQTWSSIADIYERLLEQ